MTDSRKTFAGNVRNRSWNINFEFEWRSEESLTFMRKSFCFLEHFLESRFYIQHWNTLQTEAHRNCNYSLLDILGRKLCVNCNDYGALIFNGSKEHFLQHWALVNEPCHTLYFEIHVSPIIQINPLCT